MRRALIIAAILAMAAPATVRATTYFVAPGPGTPVQDAIDAAKDGDTIRLAIGTYPERLWINKAIKVRGVRSTSVEPNQTTIVGGICDATPTIRIFANDVQLRGILVLAGPQGGVTIQGNRVKLTDIYAGSQCDTQIGAPIIDVDQSTSIKLTKVWASPLSVQSAPAGIRIAHTPQAGRIRVSNSISGHNVVGLLLEDDGIDALRVSRNAVNFNQRGIVLAGTSRAKLDHNKLVDNATTGIELDAASSGNTLVRNDVSGSLTDVSDAGSANCWHDNVYTTGSVPACP